MNPRPTVNLDPLAHAIDRAMAHPLAIAAGRLFPRAYAEVTAARCNLPAIAAAAEERVVGHVQGELAALESEAIRAVKKTIRRAFPRKRKR